MVRSLADRTFQLRSQQLRVEVQRRARVRRVALVGREHVPEVIQELVAGAVLVEQADHREAVESADNLCWL